MLKSLLPLFLISSAAIAQGGSFGVPGWNDLTVNGQGALAASSATAPAISLPGVANVHFEIDTSPYDAGSSVFFIIGAGDSVVPGAISLGFAQCQTIDILPTAIIFTAYVGVIPGSGPVTLDVPMPGVGASIDFTVQAAMLTPSSEYFLTQAHNVAVTGV